MRRRDEGPGGGKKNKLCSTGAERTQGYTQHSLVSCQKGVSPQARGSIKWLGRGGGVDGGNTAAAPLYNTGIYIYIYSPGTLLYYYGGP